MPNFENISNAFKGWIERCRARGMGFLHWMGHGATVGLESSAPLQVLYCHDQGTLAGGGASAALVERWQAGIDWLATLVGINAF